jgi:hypothetical protein
MHLIKRLLLLAGLTSLVMSVRATDFDFSGNFFKDNDIATFNFSVAGTSTVTVFSSSWIKGGFDPILAVWDSSRNLMAEQDDGHNLSGGTSNGVFYATGDWDSYYTVTLAAGSYIATVAEYANFANGTLLSDGFHFDDVPHFTSVNNYGGATQLDFNGVRSNPDPRTSDYAFHILNVDTAEQHGPGVPDSASTAALLGLGLVTLVSARRNRA